MRHSSLLHCVVCVMNSDQSDEERPGTIWAALRWAIEEFRVSRLESPRLTAEVLLAHTLSWERARLLAHLHDSLDSRSWEIFRALARRRALGEPLQYLTGEREFYGLAFSVTPAVLIPRPETEILVEKAVQLARMRERSVRFADVGTGSGCIAISFARQLPGACGWATDISAEALAVAQDNARRLGVSERVGLVRSDLLECFRLKPLFDFILSNPPYVAGAAAKDLPELVRKHEPHAALFGGDSGFEAYRRLIPQAASRLAPQGSLLLEVGAGQASQVVELVKNAGLIPDDVIGDLQGIPRCVVAQRRSYI
jgi:release factor glutamine methyltransferase